MVIVVNECHDFAPCTQCEESKTTKGDGQQFLKSLSVWINKPHVVNRRLCGSQVVHVLRSSSKQDVQAVLDEFKLFYQKKRAGDVSEDNYSCQFTDLTDEKEDFTVIVRELIPKSEFFPKLLEAIVYDKQNVKVTFLSLDQDCKGKNEDIKSTEELCYQFHLVLSDEKISELDPVRNIKLSWACDHKEVGLPRRQITSRWLRSTLLEKLINWSEIQNICTAVTSLQLVAVDKYKDTYMRLKNKYGRELVKNWTERTDPKKFVYEDVAIAAYLMLIWEEERKEKNLTHMQSFVDLGCGNGLLVYILTKEGHKGLGIDLRRRNIWSTFGPDIDLQEKTISPSGDHLYPGYDWIIGNHSDELTPWIPVIAARSSYNTSFFLLPCCPHDFIGKFNMTEKGKSRYSSYMDYVKDVIVHCGFVAETDTLRIPSTKRVCFIGKTRSYKQQEEQEMDVKRQAFIDKRTIYSSHQKLEKPGLNQPVSQVSQDRASMSCCSTYTEKHMPLLEENINSREQSVSPPRENKLNECLNGGHENFISAGDGEIIYLPHSEKRKYDNLGSYDSGVSELDFESSDETTCTKRHKGDCGEEDCEILSTDQENSEMVEKSSDTITCLSSNVGSCNASLSDKTASKTPQATVQTWVKDFQPRVEPGVRNCQRVPEQVKSQFVQVAFQLVLDAPGGTNVLLSCGKTWNKGGSVPLGQIANKFDKTEMQQLKSECGGLQTLLRNHSHIFQVTGGNVQLRDFTAENPWSGCNGKKGRNKRDNQEHTRKTTLCWFDVSHPDGCPKTNNDCSFAHGIEELKDKLNREKIVRDVGINNCGFGVYS
ncbi:hypothetical protein BsWGS_21856 [Bradybaena similaris]